MFRLKLNEKIYIAFRPKIAMQTGTKQRQLAYMVPFAESGDLVFRQYYMVFSSHYIPLIIFRLSIPLASIIFTATALPGVKGKDTVPLNASIFSSSISAFRFLESVTQPSLSLAIGKNTCEGNKLLPS